MWKNNSVISVEEVEVFRLENLYVVVECTYRPLEQKLFGVVYPVIYSDNNKFVFRHPYGYINLDSVISKDDAEEIVKTYINNIRVREEDVYKDGEEWTHIISCGVPSYDKSDSREEVIQIGYPNGAFDVNIRFWYDDRDALEMVCNMTDVYTIIEGVYFEEHQHDLFTYNALQYPKYEKIEELRDKPITITIAVDVNL